MQYLFIIIGSLIFGISCPIFMHVYIIFRDVNMDKLICPNCKRKVPNQDFIVDNKCAWCDAEKALAKIINKK